MTQSRPRRSALAPAAMILVALGLAACQPKEAGETAVASPPSPPPSWQEAANGSYAGLDGGMITLDGGEWQGEPYVAGGAAAPRVGLADHFILHGDFDGDGVEESAVLVWTSSGGSGTFNYLAVVGRTDAGVVLERASAELGDRVKLREGKIVGSRIVLDVVQAGPDDAACCPGQKVRRSFLLDGDVLREVATEDQGRLSLADLGGEWTLRNSSLGGDIPAEATLTLAFEAERISGASACNRFSGSVVAEEPPGQLRIAGPLAVTRMMCAEPAMMAEARYLEALQGVSGYTFVAGDLVLSWAQGEAMGVLRFARSAESVREAE